MGEINGLSSILGNINGMNPWVARVFIVTLAFGGLEIKERWLEQKPLTRYEVESIVTSQAPFIQYQRTVLDSVSQTNENTRQIQILQLEMRDAHQEIRDLIHRLELEIARRR